MPEPLLAIIKSNDLYIGERMDWQWQEGDFIMVRLAAGTILERHFGDGSLQNHQLYRYIDVQVENRLKNMKVKSEDDRFIISPYKTEDIRSEKAVDFSLMSNPDKARIMDRRQRFREISSMEAPIRQKQSISRVRRNG